MQVIFISGQTLHLMLSKLKDPLPMENQSEVVYPPPPLRRHFVSSYTYATHLQSTHCLGASGSATKLGTYLFALQLVLDVLHSRQGGCKELAIVKPITNSSVFHPPGLRDETASKEGPTPVTSSSFGLSVSRLVAFVEESGAVPAAAPLCPCSTSGSDALKVCFWSFGVVDGRPPPAPTRALGPN